MTTFNPPPPPPSAPFGAPEEPKGKKQKTPKAPREPKAPKQPKETAAKQSGVKSPTAAAWPGPVKPSAVLVPRYVRERRASQETLRIVVIAVIATLVLSLGLLAWSFMAAKSAESAKNEAVAGQQGLQGQVDALSNVALYYDGLVSRQDVAVGAMKNDLDTSELVNEIYTLAAKASVRIQSLSIPTAGTACPGSNPFRATNSLGCVNLEVGYDSIDDVAKFIDLINGKEEFYNSAFANTFTPGGTSASTAVTFNYTPELLSLAFVPADQREQVRQSYVIAIDPVTGQPAAPAPAIDPATGQPVAPAAPGQPVPPATSTPIPPAGGTPAEQIVPAG